MGFKAKKRIYVIKDWPDEDMEGLEIRAKSVKLKEFIGLSSLMDTTEVTNNKEAEDAVTGLIRFFADSLLSWNLEDEDDTPIPATYEGLLDQENDFVMRIIFTWMKIIGGTSDDLKASLTGGGTSLAESIPMETLSPNQES